MAARRDLHSRGVATVATLATQKRPVTPGGVLRMSARSDSMMAAGASRPVPTASQDSKTLGGNEWPYTARCHVHTVRR